MLVGRGLELERIAARLSEERPRLAVAGEPGIGKTALVRAGLAATGRPVFEGGAFATLSWMPFLALERAVGGDLAGDPAYAAAVVEQRVGRDGVLFLDDLHWADEQTLETIAQLRGRIALVVAVRSGDPGFERALEAAEPDELVRLDGLSDESARELVRARAPGLGDAAAKHLVRSAGGNPLLLEELAASDGVPDSLRLALAARLRLLTPEAMRAMSLLALAGRPLELRALPGGAAGELVEAGLAATAGGTIAPRHALLAETAAELLDAEERQSVHADLAELVTDPGEQAVHLAAAGLTVAAQAAARLAADRATTPGERVTHLDLAARCAPPGSEVALQLEAAEELSGARLIPQLAELLDRIEPPDDEARARVEFQRSVVALDLGDAPEAEAALERGLALVGGGGSTTEGLLLSRKGLLAKLLHNQPQLSVELARAGAALADANDLPRTLNTLAWMLSEAGAPQEEWVAAFVDAIEAAQAVSKPSVELMARNNLCGCLSGSPEPSAARPHLEEAVERARELRFLDWERDLRSLQLTVDLGEGLFDRVIEGCEELLADPLTGQLRATLLVLAAEALAATGRFAEAAQALDALEQIEAVRDYIRGRGRMVRADLELWAGRPKAAVELADAIVRDDRPELAYLRFETEIVRAWALFELGRNPEPPAGEDVTTPDAVRKDELRAIPLLDRDAAAATRAFEALVEAWRPFSRRDELRCLWAAGEAARRSAETSAALELLHDAERRAGELGMKPLLARVHRSLRLLGEPRAAERSADGALTRREREILDLVGSGLSNPEIARRLGTSVPTVARQIATASAKLGAKTRAQAAALAAGR